MSKENRESATRIFAVKTSLLVLLSCILLNISFHLHAHSPNQRMDIYFEHISLEHGLSQSSVYCILQDSKGFLWFATEDGLNRYDGYNFVVYKRDLKNPNSLDVNWLWSIFEDHADVLWIGTFGGGLHKFDPEKNVFTRYQTIPGDSNSLSSNFVRSISEDHAGMLWIGTDEGLNRFDPKNKTFIHYKPNPPDPNSLSHRAVRTVYVDRSGVLWIGTMGGGLNKFEPKKETFIRYMNQPSDEKSLSHNYVRSIYQDRLGTLWIGTMGGGLNKFDQEKETFSRYLSDPRNPNSLSHNGVYAIYEDQSGVLWIGTDNGLNIFDREKEIFTHIQEDIRNPYSLSVNAIRSIYEDRTGVLWIGTYLGGINKFNKEKKRFTHYHKESDNPNSLSDNKVWAIWEDRAGVLWIGTSDGLNKLDRKRETFVHYQHDPKNPNSLNHKKVRAIYEDRTGVLWIGTEGGINIFDRKTETFTLYKTDPADPNSLSNDMVISIYEDQSGVLWFGTFYGLNKFDREKQAFIHYQNDIEVPSSLSNNLVISIYEDRTGVLWIGTEGGLNTFDREKETFTRYQADPANPDSLSNNDIYFIGEDQSGTLWIGTGGGLSKFDRERESFVRYGLEDGLPNEVIYGVLEDVEGNLWLSTNKGLSMFNPQTETFKNYDIRDGLQSDEFNSGAFHKSRSGEMFFGGINGFNAFFPGSIKDNPHKPPIVITDLKIFNNSVSIGEEMDGLTILKKDISETREIKLSYKHTVLSFEYAGLHYAVPGKNQYAYKMEGLEKEWNYVGNRRFATYAHLTPGEYVFRVRCSNNDGVWNEEGVSLKITIFPPFWKTGWFYLLCILFFLLSIMGLHRLRVRRLKYQEKRLTQLVNERTQELEKANRYKSDFLARMSHEIRTPMNSIIGFTDLVLDTQLSEDQYDFIKAIRESGEVLLDIINEILDLSKIEAGQLSLKSIDFDPKVMAFSVCELFIPRIEEKPIQILCHVGNEVPLNVKGDPGRFRQVLINLMGNAVKFTQEGEVELAIHIEKEENHRVKLHTKVRDTGIGIPEDKRDSIFKAFQQADVSAIREYGGTGLGLSICTHIAQLMGGNIWVESKPGKGSTFHFTAWMEKSRKKTVRKHPPSYEHITKKKALIKDGSESIPTQHPLMEHSRQSVRILMAEDNALNRKLARFMLCKAGYRVDMVTNGKEAVEKFRSNPEKFDLILMDIQMPVMDGYEATKKIREIEKNRKENLHDSSFITHPSSHIPIIAMTAASMKGDPEKCFEAGMTDYISKPIKKEVLYSVIERWGRWKTRDE